MAVTMKQVRAALDPEEPNYNQAAALGPEALPHLRTLVNGAQPMLASKAAYLAGLIAAEGSAGVLAEAAASDDPVVRVAAAAAARHLKEEDSSQLLVSLLADADPGVQTMALRSVPDDPKGALRAAVEDLGASADDSWLKSAAASLLTPSEPRAAEPLSPPAEGEMPPLPLDQPGGMTTDNAGEMPPLPPDQPRGMTADNAGEMPPLPLDQPGGTADTGGEMPPLPTGSTEAGFQDMPSLSGDVGDLSSSGEMPPLSGGQLD